MKRGRFAVKANAFTLIELLVVIAIIAILAAILFPVFAQAREKARAIMCLNNTKQLAIAVQQYVQDYDETLPARQQCLSPKPGGGYMQIEDLLNPYIKMANTQGSVWKCPSFPVPNQDRQIGVNASLFPDGLCTGWNVAGGYDDKGNYATLAMIDRPADLAAMLDKGANSGAGNWMEFTSDQWAFADASVCKYDGPQNNGCGNPNDDGDVGKLGEGALVAGKGDCDLAQNGDNWNWSRSCFLRPRYRHNGTCNVTFLDGHSKAVPKGQFRFSKNLHIQQVHGNMW